MTDIDYEALAQEHFHLSLQIKEMEARKSEVSALLKKDREIDNYPTERFIVSVQRNARFDPDVARAALTDAEYERILETKPSPALAKERLSPELYRESQKEFAPKVIVSRIEDWS